MNAKEIKQQYQDHVESVRTRLSGVKATPLQAQGAGANREKLAISMRAVANATGIHYTALSRFSNGQSQLSPGNLDKVSEYLDGVA